MITIKCPDCKHETILYSTEDAANYAKLLLTTFKHHIYQSNVKGQLIGHTLMFEKEELDRFLSTKRGPGRPRRNTP